MRSKTDTNRSKRLPSGRANERNDRSERSAQESTGGFAIQNRSKKFASRNRKINGASRSMSNQVYVGGGFESQDASKKVKKNHWFYKVFGYFSRFMLNSSSRRFQDGSKRRPRRLQDASRDAQDASKTTQEAPKTPPRRPKTTQEAPKTPPRRP